MTHQETEFHLTIGITVRGAGWYEPVQSYVANAVQELAHSRLFLAGRTGEGVVSEHDDDHGRVVTTTTVTRCRRPTIESTLPPHQQRVLAEKSELDDRLSKLTAFISSPKFIEIVRDEDERGRLVAQEESMKNYSAILAERIAAF